MPHINKTCLLLEGVIISQPSQILSLGNQLVKLRSLVVGERCNHNWDDETDQKIIILKGYLLSFLNFQLSHILAIFTTCSDALIVMNVGQDGSSEVKYSVGSKQDKWDGWGSWLTVG